MADTTVKLSGTYDSIEAYELLEEMRSVASSYLPLTGGEISGDLIVDGQLSGNLTGNVTGTASGNLPLSGGTMTGTLRLASGGNIIASNVDDSSIGLRGGSDGTSAYLNLYGKNNASYAGHFSLTAYDGTNRKSLAGLPDGTLTWANNNVLTDATVGTVLTNSNSSNVNLTANTTTKITSVTLSAGTWVVTGHLQYTSVVTRQFASLNDSGTLNAGVEGTAVHYAGSSSSTTLALCVTRIFVLTSSTEIRLNGFASVACTAGLSHITAVRIK